MSSPVIFLDFDDVLSLPAEGKPGAYDVMLAMRDIQLGNNSISDFEEIWSSLFDEDAVANLLTLHEEFDPTYVLSTSWTRFLDLESLLLVMHQTGLAFIAESLHPNWETEKSRGSTRAQQIRDWLKKHPAVDNWVALDDSWSATGFGAPPSNVVLCPAGKGFSNQALRQAWSILQGQLPRCESDPEDHKINASAQHLLIKMHTYC